MWPLGSRSSRTQSWKHQDPCSIHVAWLAIPGDGLSRKGRRGVATIATSEVGVHDKQTQNTVNKGRFSSTRADICIHGEPMLATIQMRPDRRGLAGGRPLWSWTVSAIICPSMTRAKVDAWRMRLQMNHHTNGRSLSCRLADCTLTLTASIASLSIVISSLHALVPSGRTSDA